MLTFLDSELTASESFVECVGMMEIVVGWGGGSSVLEKRKNTFITLSGNGEQEVVDEARQMLFACCWADVVAIMVVKGRDVIRPHDICNMDAFFPFFYK